MNEEKRLLGYYDYTVVLTYIGMICGVIGIAHIMCEKFDVAIVCLMIAGVCDMFDGTVASTKKRTDSEKKFGIQIDSLSDLICFGVLPGLFVYEFSSRVYIGMMTAAFYILCALIRLAYFNVSEEERQQSEGGTRKYYQGLPVTSAALILPAVYIFANNIYIYISAIALMGVLFLVPFKLRKPKTFGKAILGIMGISEMFVLILGVIDGI